jgi:hypothetical protein
MNKYLIIIISLLVVNSANAKKVKFSVDMTGQTVSVNGVHVAGDFQEEAGYEGGDWQSNTTLMIIDPGTVIYSIIVDIPAFTKYEYKFINGDQWYEVEFVPLESRVGYDYNDNRWIYVDSLFNDTTNIPAVMFSGNAPAGYYLLRLRVNLQMEEEISPYGIHVAGDFQNGDPGSTIMYSFGDKIYEQIVYAGIWTDYADSYYRFMNGITEEDYEAVPGECAEDGYRYVEILQDTVIETVCFSACVNCDQLGTGEISWPQKARVFPNPCVDAAIVEFNDVETSHDISVVNILGNTVKFYHDFRGKSLQLHRDELPPGIYFLQMESNDRWLNTLRLVISD